MLSKMRWSRNLFVLSTLLLAIFGGSESGDAKIVSVDSGQYFDAKNSLLIEKSPVIKGFEVSTNVPSNRMEIYDKPKSASHAGSSEAGMAFFGSDAFKSKHYGNYEKGYASKSFVIKNPTSADKFTVKWKNVGSYNGKSIDLKMDMLGITYRLNPTAPITMANKIWLDISESPFNGFVNGNMGHFEPEFTFFDSGTGSEINFEGDSYLTFNSLNGNLPNYAGEFVNYLNDDVSVESSSSTAYLAKDTNIQFKQFTDSSKSSYLNKPVFVGVSDNFVDQLGSDNFTRNSVSFQIKGKRQKFVLGSGLASGWFALSSATVFSTKPENPMKDVLDDQGRSVNKQEVLANQKLVYAIDQKVHNLGVDLLERYSKFEFIDPLPEEVIFESAKFEADPKGAISYDKEKHTVKYQASNDFLQSMPLKGESYRLKINVKVKDDIRSKTIFKNQGKVVLDTHESPTNKVENKGSDPKGTFTIYKVTDQLTGFENETLLPKYEEKPQADVSYQITAEEPVTLTDGTLVAEKNSDFGKITSDEEGIATKKDIYAGKYRAVEVAAPIGIQVDPTPIIIDVVSNKDTATGKGEQKDPLQEVELKIHKTFEQEDGTFKEIGGAKFGLFHAINHKIDDENVILKDTLVSEIEIDEKGQGTYKGILIPEQQYYIKEISTKEGYQLNQEKFYFSYIPVSNDAVHMIELYGNGYIDADVKKDYETERTEKNENKNPEVTSGEDSKESTSQSNTEQTEESSTDNSKEDVELVDIKNLLIKENNIVKSILKEDGSKVDHYELLSNGEKVMFEGLVYIGDNEKIESLKVVDELPNGFSFEESKIYDESGNDITNQTTIKNEGQKVTLEIKNEYAKELRRTSIRWVIQTAYKFSMDHKDQVFENQMHLILNDEDIPSNIVTLTPPDIEEKPVVQKPKGILPNTGEIQGYLSVVGVALVLCIVAFWYTRNEQNPEDESNDKTE